MTQHNHNLTPPTQPLGQNVDQSAQSTQPAQGANHGANLAFPEKLAPKLNVTKRRELPTGVASNVKQPVLLLLDRSTSMNDYNKIEELNIGLKSFGAVLADPQNKDGFLITLIAFNHKAEVLASFESAQTLIYPDLIASGSTNFDAAIKAAIKELRAFNARPNPEGWHYLRPKAMLFSDGNSPVADQNIYDFQEVADVTAVAYGMDADHNTLSRIASDGQVHMIGTDGGALRDFLAQVGHTLVTDGKMTV